MEERCRRREDLDRLEWRSRFGLGEQERVRLLRVDRDFLSSGLVEREDICLGMSEVGLAVFQFNFSLKCIVMLFYVIFMLFYVEVDENTT